jgi:hypothetical protein
MKFAILAVVLSLLLAAEVSALYGATSKVKILKKDTFTKEVI